MARLWTDGAEGATGDFWNSYTTPIVYASDKRSGGYSYQMNPSFIGSLPIKNVSPALTEFYYRGPFKWASSSQACSPFVWGSGMKFSYNWPNYDRRVSASINNVVVANGTTVFLETQWHLLEVHIKIAVDGVIQVKVDNSLEIDYSGDTTNGGTFTACSAITYTCGSGLGDYPTLLVDDLALNDTTTAYDNSWCGDGHIIALVPNANGDSSQFVGSDGNSTDNYALVDERPPNDTDYVEHDTVGYKDLYNLAASGLTSADIFRVWTKISAKDTTTGNGRIATLLKTESTEYEGPVIELTTNYVVYDGIIYKDNPFTGTAWTVEELDALQVGMIVKA